MSLLATKAEIQSCDGATVPPLELQPLANPPAGLGASFVAAPKGGSAPTADAYKAPLAIRSPAPPGSQEITRISVPIAVPSVLYIETGSAFLPSKVGIGIEVPEGVWVGEQR